MGQAVPGRGGGSCRYLGGVPLRGRSPMGAVGSLGSPVGQAAPYGGYGALGVSRGSTGRPPRAGERRGCPGWGRARRCPGYRWEPTVSGPARGCWGCCEVPLAAAGVGSGVGLPSPSPGAPCPRCRPPPLLKATKVPGLGVAAPIFAVAASPGRQLHAGGDAGGLWGARRGPACPCLLLPSSCCPGAGEVLPAKAGGEGNLCPREQAAARQPCSGAPSPPACGVGAVAVAAGACFKFWVLLMPWGSSALNTEANWLLPPYLPGFLTAIPVRT